MRRVLAVALLVVVIVSAAGCKSSGATVTLREVDTGRTVELKRGDQLILELEGNPTTGFQWEAQDMDAGFLKQKGNAEFKSDQQGAMGGGGLFVLTFAATKAGSTPLRLIYHQPWDKETPPAKTFEVIVSVQ
jgi:inhibitor of cysteine peptidase